MSIFKTIQGNKQRKTAFNLSHDKKLSMRMGDLVPILCEEVVPGDSWNIRTQSFIRLAPMIAPVMHSVDAYIHYFFVPNRLLNGAWEKFITGDSSAALPTLGEEEIIKGGLGDFLGLPPMTAEQTDNQNISLFPFQAYTLIYNEYYRDQNLQDEIDITDQAEIIELRKRAWEKDYFTSALPWTQKGAEGVLPFDTTVTYKDPSFFVQSTVPEDSARTLNTSAFNAADDQYHNRIRNSAGTEGYIDNVESIEGQITINEFRIAHRIQKWFERQARAGSRYTETLLSHFGTHTGDARLQRPEYLGGGKQPVVMSEVLQTSESATTPQGTMSGHGISVGNTAKAHQVFKEHGYILAILSVMPKPAYQQGIHKSWLRQDKFDYYWPEFAHLGEQAVLNKELYLQHNAGDLDTFGYQSRYAEYKYKAPSVHGDMRTSLAFWHMGRIFSAAPSLNEAFIRMDGSSINARVFAAGDAADQLWVQIHHSIIARRPMPYYATPTI